MCLLNGINGVTLGFEVLYSVQRIFVILPFDGFFCTECGLVDLGVGRTTTDTA